MLCFIFLIVILIDDKDWFLKKNKNQILKIVYIQKKKTFLAYFGIYSIFKYFSMIWPNLSCAPCRVGLG